nr:serine hydrolase [uncultured Sandarakinorhabdus sp.]
MLKILPTSISRPAVLLFAAVLAGASQAQPAPASDPNRPTSLADMQGATTLDVERYRPRVALAGCTAKSLKQRKPGAGLAKALAAAQAYSDSQGGFGLVVMRDGAVIHEHYGQGVTATRPVVTASMAKSVLGLMIGIALDRKLIGSVDDPLETYLPEWAGDPRGRITIAQALQMQTGLAPSNFQAVLLAPDVSKAAMATPLAGTPGASFGYNNAISQLLLTALDRQLRKAGQGGYARFLERELWCPLGNGPASLWVDAGGTPRGYAGLNASAHDWARIGELIRNQGRSGKRQLVPKSWIAAMATPSPANKQYGYQLWLGREWTAQRRYSPENPVTVKHSEAFVAPDLVYFDGFGGQRVYVVPSRRLTIVRLGQVSMAWDDALVPNAIVRALY